MLKHLDRARLIMCMGLLKQHVYHQGSMTQHGYKIWRYLQIKCTFMKAGSCRKHPKPWGARHLRTFYSFREGS